MARSFSISWDYRCPFARNAAEHVLVGLDAGADWDVTWVPFSLNQVHVAEGDPAVWDDPAMESTLYPMLAGIAVRDLDPERFRAAHFALFTARHDEGRDLREAAIVDEVLAAAGVDVDAVKAEIAGGGILDRFRKEHEAAARDFAVWGVPTFIAGDSSVFVRLMTRPRGDGDLARTTIERVLDLVTGFPELNEFKHTSIPR